MQIRLAELSDIPQIIQMIAEVVPAMIAAGNFQWDSTYPNAEVFEKDIALQQLWVAAIDDEIVGVSAITTDQSPEYAEVGWDLNEPSIVTHRLAVSPKHQGKGIAAALLLKAEEVATNKGINALKIDTNTANHATQRLFPKLGYVFAGEIGLGFREGLRFYCYEKRV
ncbi:GNAT family N-acetyltransferase [Mucilaginibacter sp.]|uniref:GNAT family N-acetyltransferase n=1 Tax=Mucilaginibacter sp. TaxID=1882438 RepID=UPI002841CA11|nr:GNAT family N-acetyltransferase [Mucilaginibacter sp.]MDR3693345.1 GNAT family N-acetyltransferase [Mucilaginibacter sp.]